jgi:serine phosphatase RsbU (regulator of sigma subunit)
MVGLFPGTEITGVALEFRPGDTLVLYSDGVTEAHDPSDRMFEEEGLLACLDGAAGRPAEEVTGRVMEAVRRHAGNAPQYDDITVLTVRRKP